MNGAIGYLILAMLAFAAMPAQSANRLVFKYADLDSKHHSQVIEGGYALPDGSEVTEDPVECTTNSRWNSAQATIVSVPATSRRIAYTSVAGPAGEAALIVSELDGSFGCKWLSDELLLIWRDFLERGAPRMIEVFDVVDRRWVFRRFKVVSRERLADPDTRR